MNVIYIHTHDSGRIVSPYGYAVPTPSLSEFASDATLFRQAYCVSPTCSPSRAALLTGTYPHENGMLGLAQRGFQLDCSKHLVPFLNAHGYQSVLCGIQHEAGWYLDHERGAEILGYQKDITNPTDGYRQEDMGAWDLKNAESAVSFLHSYDSKQPLFLSFGMYSTHRRYPDTIDPTIDENQVIPPYPIPDTPKTREDHARYLTSAKCADACFHNVIQALKDSGLYEESIIIFTTDHGLANPFCKCTLFDSGIGVSLIIRTPNAKTKGKAVDQLVSHIDVFPTLCDLLGFEKPSWLRGTSFANSFEDINAKTRDEIYAEVSYHTSYEPIRCIRNQRYKYIRYYDTKYLQMNLSNIDESLTKDYFMEHDLTKRVKYKEAFYDTIYDMQERCNLLDHEEVADIVKELSDKLDRHMVTTKDPLCDGEITIQPTWKVNKKECIQASSKNPQDYVSFDTRGE